MKKSGALAAVMAASLMFTAGCSGYTEIQNMDIFTSHFVYKNGRDVLLGGGVANVRTLADNMADNPVHYICASGKNVSDAFENLRRSADHKLFFGSMRIIIIDNEYAKDGIGDFLNYISSMPDHRTSVNAVTSSSDPREIVEYKAVNDFTGGFAAESIIHTLKNQNLMPDCSLADIWEARMQKQAGYILPDITISDNIMRLGGYSIFDFDKKIASLPLEYSSGINYLLSRRASESYGVYLDDGKYFSVRADMKKRRIKIRRTDEGNIHFDITFIFSIEATGADTTNLTDKEKEAIKQTSAERIKTETEEVLLVAKQLGCDFLGLCKSYQAKERRDFLSLDWGGEIKNMTYTVEAEISNVHDDPVR